MMKAALLLVALAATISHVRAGPVTEAIGAIPELSMLLDALEYTGQASILDAWPTKDKLTVFAPDNQAFLDSMDATFNATSIADIPKSVLSKILQYHLVPEYLEAEDLKDGTTLATALTGHSVHIKKTSKGLFIEPEVEEPPMVTKSDIVVPNYDVVIHVVDIMLLPDIPEVHEYDVDA